jgi:hypothetical protein
MGPWGWSCVGVARGLRAFPGVAVSPGPVAGRAWRRWRFVACGAIACVTLMGLAGAGTARGSTVRSVEGAPCLEAPVACPAEIEGFSLTGMSCSSDRACTAIGERFDGDQVVDRWNGRSWSIQHILPSGFALQGVSCPSLSACFVVGFLGASENSGPVPIVGRWAGGRWTFQSTPPASAALDQVSCSSPGACTAIGMMSEDGAPLLERWDGSSWSVEPAPAQMSELDLVSCPSAKGCVAFGLGRGGVVVERWDGARWSPQRLPALHRAGATVTDLSCSSVTACVAVANWTPPGCDTSEGLAGGGLSPGAIAQAARACPSGVVAWRLHGSRWSEHSFFSAVAFSVSCVSATWCVFDEGGGSALLWNGTRWTPQLTPRDGLPVVISCTSITACIAIGGTPKFAWLWNGTNWHSVPGPATARA